jgi:hypothetical protein
MSSILLLDNDDSTVEITAVMMCYRSLAKSETARVMEIREYAEKNLTTNMRTRRLISSLILR